VQKKAHLYTCGVVDKQQELPEAIDGLVPLVQKDESGPKMRARVAELTAEARIPMFG
jgi:hypothetical protein